MERLFGETLKSDNSITFVVPISARLSELVGLYAYVITCLFSFLLPICSSVIPGPSSDIIRE